MLRRRLKMIFDNAAGAMCFIFALSLATGIISNPEAASNPFQWVAVLSLTWATAELIGGRGQ